MNATRLLALICLAAFAQGALASTIWLKDRNGNVCYNSLSTLGGPPSGAPGGYIGLGGINKDGSGYSLTLSNPTAGIISPATGDCTTIPKSDTNLTFTGGTVVPNNVAITRIGTGAKDAGQCLDQGSNLVGVTGGSSVLSGATTWTLAFSYTAAAGCKTGTQSAPFQRPVSLAKKTGPFSTVTYTGTYHIFNANAIPEPATPLLLLAGGLGLGIAGLLRRRLGARSR